MRWVLLLVGMVSAFTDPSLQGYHPDLPPLREALRTFPTEEWSVYLKAHNQRPTTEMLYNATQFLRPYIDATSTAKGQAPYIQPPPLPVLNCQDPLYAGIFTGKKRAVPAKIFDFIPMNHELDVLEIRLYELYDVIDYMVVMEGTHTHRGQRKPLFLARHYDRYRVFHSKVIHLVTDDSAQLRYARPDQPNVNLWEIENQMREMLYEKFVNATGYTPGPTDLLIHGDCDEVPSRRHVYHLKHCEVDMSKLPLSFHTSYFMSALRAAMPLTPGHRLNMHWLVSYAQHLYFPNVFSVNHLLTRNGKKAFNRAHDARAFGDTSGGHFNRFSGSLVDVVYKELTTGEVGMFRGDLYFMRGIEQNINMAGYVHDDKYINTFGESHFPAQRSSAEQRAKAPWILHCTPWRYPFFVWTPDEARVVLRQAERNEPIVLPTTWDGVSPALCHTRPVVNRSVQVSTTPPRLWYHPDAFGSMSVWVLLAATVVGVLVLSRRHAARFKELAAAVMISLCLGLLGYLTYYG